MHCAARRSVIAVPIACYREVSVIFVVESVWFCLVAFRFHWNLCETLNVCCPRVGGPTVCVCDIENNISTVEKWSLGTPMPKISIRWFSYRSLKSRTHTNTRSYHAVQQYQPAITIIATTTSTQLILAKTLLLCL